MTAGLTRSQVRRSIGAALVAAWSLGAAAQEPGIHPSSGRRFAEVMSYQGAEWLDRRERVEEEAPDEAIAALDVRRGETVADLGAGSGYMTVRLARRVSPTVSVYAVDIQPAMLALLSERLKRDRIANVVPVLGEVDNPKLPSSSVVLVLMVDVYHELQAPQQMLRRVRDALKPSGRLVLIVYRKEDR